METICKVKRITKQFFFKNLFKFFSFFILENEWNSRKNLKIIFFFFFIKNAEFSKVIVFLCRRSSGMQTFLCLHWRSYVPCVLIVWDEWRKGYDGLQCFSLLIYMSFVETFEKVSFCEMKNLILQHFGSQAFIDCYLTGKPMSLRIRVLAFPLQNHWRRVCMYGAQQVWNRHVLRFKELE